MGRTIYVNGVKAVVGDWCACPDGRVLDAYGSLFGLIAPLSVGLTRVTVVIP